MKLRILLTLVLSATIITECRRLTKDELTESQEFFKSIPEDEKEDFLAYALGHAWMEQNNIHHSRRFPFPTLLELPPDLENKFKSIDMPEKFTSNLYQFVKSTFHLNSTDMFRLARRRRVCLPSGKCIDFENIGQLCCPF